MNGYKQILVGIDFTETTSLLIDKAVCIGKLFDADITLVHVIDYLPPVYAMGELPNAFVSEAVLCDLAKNQLADVMKTYPETKYQSRVVIGRRKSSFTKIANEIGADLAILGRQDLSENERFLGSTTYGVISRSSFDVLVVQPEKNTVNVNKS